MQKGLGGGEEPVARWAERAVTAVRGDGPNSVIAVELWDHDQVTKDEFLGRACFTGRDVAELALAGAGNDEEMSQYAYMLGGAASTGRYDIKCHIKAGRNIPAMDVDGTSDPYARAFIGENYAAGPGTFTKCLENELDPEWDEVLAFEGVREKDFLTIEVLDADTFGDDDVIGTVTRSHIRTNFLAPLTSPHLILHSDPTAGTVKIRVEDAMATYLSTGGGLKWYKLEGEEADAAEVELAFDISPEAVKAVTEDGSEDEEQPSKVDDSGVARTFHMLCTHPKRSQKYVKGHLGLRVYRKRMREDDVRLFHSEKDCQTYKDGVKAVEAAGQALMRSHREYREANTMFPALEDEAKKEVR
jgi:hypothetical protein